MANITPAQWQSLGRKIRLLLKLATEFQTELKELIGPGPAEPKQMLEVLRFLRGIHMTLRHAAVASVKQHLKAERYLGATEEAFAVTTDEMDFTKVEKRALEKVLEDDDLREEMEEERHAATVRIVRKHFPKLKKPQAERVATMLYY